MTRGRSGNWGTTASAAAAAAAAAASAFRSTSAAAPGQELPREQTLILNNPEGAAANPGWFNIWVNGGGGTSTGLHQLAMDTLWYIDPDAGVNGVVIQNSLATGPAQYNADFSEMTVPLRDGIYWSDGEKFTAKDVVFTVETQMNTPGMNWSGPSRPRSRALTLPTTMTVHFVLQNPNSRFHSIFSVRWNAAWIMPEHIFSGVDDVISYDFNPPVGLGPYTLHSFDPNGSWYIWEKREDWDRTAIVDFGEPMPQYAIYRSITNLDNRLIEMNNGDLDMIHDLTPEGMFSIVKDNDARQDLVPGLPLRPSRSHAADVHLQPSEREVPGSSGALGARPDARRTRACRWPATAGRQPSRRSRSHRPARIWTTITPRCRKS